jgi:glycosyltransferase involved in cell wall biosynthesis
MPKVTVLMPTYNVAPYVREAIDSVLQQTYHDFELLVIDDCSTDDTVSVVRSIDDPRIRIVQNEKNVGLAENLNRGLSHITTEYVARMDGDDIAEPYWLEKEAAMLDNHPEIGICSGGFERFGTVKSLVRFPERHEDCMANMLFECSVIVPTFRMSLYRGYGLRYSTEAFPAEDYRFWAECLRVTKIYNIQETLFHYRMHPTQICTARREEQQRKVAQVRRYMLEWLSEDFTEMEKDYYTGAFMAPQIASKQDYRERKAFCQKMIEKNRSVGNFDEAALRQRLDKHLTLTLYSTIVGRFFANGYSLPRYLRYLKSGLALRTRRKYETKFLIKSILHRKA